LTAEIVAANGARETATFAGGGDVDHLHVFKGVDIDLAAYGKIARSTADFADESLWLAASLSQQFDAIRRALLRALAFELGNVTTYTSAGKPPGHISETQLDRFVTISLDGPDLQDVARPGLNDRYRNYLPRLIEELRHPDLAAEYSNCHRSVPCQLSRGRIAISSRLTRWSSGHVLAVLCFGVAGFARIRPPIINHSSP
jgi:hypothetical protein